MNKTTRLFTQVLDDIIRSPHLTSTEFRLYCVMQSYCAKSDQGDERECRLTKEILSGILKVSERAVFKSLRRLSELGLIVIEHSGSRYGPSTYKFPSETTHDLCPEQLKGQRFSSAKGYVQDQGGVRKLQRKQLPKRRTARSVGRATSMTGADDCIEVAPGDPCEKKPGGTGVPPGSSTHAVSGGTGVPPQVELEFQPGGTGVPPYGDSLSHSGGTGVPPQVELEFHPGGTGVPPQVELEFIQVQDTGKNFSIVPNGRSAEVTCDLGLPSPYAREHTPSFSEVRTADENPSVKSNSRNGVHRRDITDITSAQNTPISTLVVESPVAKESKEQEAARKARAKTLRKGSRSAVVDVKVPTAASATSDDGEAAKPPRKRRGKSAADDGSLDPDTQKLIEDTTPDPALVGVVPNSPWHFYAHFVKEVQAKYPDCGLAKHPEDKYLKWAKTMLKTYDHDKLYEAIRVLVLDYENIGQTRMFFKYAGSPHPTFLQLQGNIELLVSLAGKGVVSPPSVRISPYYSDYEARKRGDKQAATAEVEGGRTDNQSTTQADPIQSLRDRYRDM